MENEKSCLKCKVLNRTEQKLNMLGEPINVIQCKECGSLSVSKDGVHWSLVAESNDKRDREMTK